MEVKHQGTSDISDSLEDQIAQVSPFPPREMLLHELFSAQAKRSPEAVALVEPQTASPLQTDPATLSYAELEHRSDALAGYLQQQGCRPNSIVGIFMKSSMDYVTAMLAALKVGAAYLPIDLAHPELLLGAIIEQTEICIIVTHMQWLGRLRAFPQQETLALDQSYAWQNCDYQKHLIADLSLENYAYVVFSSGSTGQPKGIVAPHHGAVHSYWERFKYFQVQPDDRVACNVFFVWEVLRPLLIGGTSYIISDDLIYDPQQLLQYLQQWRITEILFTPSLLEKVLQSYTWLGQSSFEQAFAHMKAIWLNGEVVSRNLRRKILHIFSPFQKRLQVFNLYSISESHDVALIELHQMSEEAHSDVCSVGKMIDGVTVHIFRYGKSYEDSVETAPQQFDPKLLLPCRPFEQGEIYVGGATLALGYLMKEQLTAERFIYWQPPPQSGGHAKPNDNGKAQRLYRTGDLGCFILPGNGSSQPVEQQENWQRLAEIQVDGRCDSMVKLRGYSVHLGMVEAALCACSGVLHAAAAAEGGEGSDKHLIAYVVRDPLDPGNWQIQAGTNFCHELRSALKEHLPHYMLPHAFIELDNIPIDPVSGKAVRKALPKPQLHSQKLTHDSTLPTLSQLSQAYQSKEQSQESILEQLWCRILRLPLAQLHLRKDYKDIAFFDLGGHSLLAAELASTFEQVLHHQISVREIYSYPSLSQQLHYLQSGNTASQYNLQARQRQIASQMRQDAKLCKATAEKLQQQNTQPIALSQAQHIFITGSTGFLGAFVLTQLRAKANSSCRFHCLLRSSSPETGAKRILDNLRYYHLLDESELPDWQERLIPHFGDLNQEMLGLGQTDYQIIAQETDLIFHCASLVNYLYPYEVIKGPAVEGTQSILCLAADACAALHYISTNGICASDQARPVFLEDRNIGMYPDFLDNGYGQGKWVAEEIVWQAIDAGLSACIYRPGNLGHSMYTARYNPNDFQTLIIQATLHLKSAPLRSQDSPWNFEFTPVNFLAECISVFAEQAQQYGLVFHIVEADGLDCRPLFQRMQSEGLLDYLLPYHDWLKLLKKVAQETGDTNLLVLSEGLDDVELWLNDASTYDDRLLRQHCQRPSVNMAYYWQLVEALQQDLAKLQKKDLTPRIESKHTKKHST